MLKRTENGETINSNFGEGELMVSSFFVHLARSLEGRTFTIPSEGGLCYD